MAGNEIWYPYPRTQSITMAFGSEENSLFYGFGVARNLDRETTRDCRVKSLNSIEARTDSLSRLPAASRKIMQTPVKYREEKIRN